MLTLYRRHVKTCPHRAKGRTWPKCSCPIWADGTLGGKRYRRSLGLRDWARAGRKLAALEAGLERLSKPVHAAVELFLTAGEDLAMGTRRNYRRTLNYLAATAERQEVHSVAAVDAEFLDGFRASRAISPLTWGKELQILRHFFRFCMDRKWATENPAKLLASPRNLKPAPREPYTPQEVARILAACDGIGRGPYERLRARAMILLLRYTALRVGDVATLARERVRNGEIQLYTVKEGTPVRLPVHSELQAALDVLPVPRGCGTSRYFFWSGHGSARSMVRDATRTLAVVFKASGVAGAHAHRFRHTLATEILERGGSIEDAADVLGNSPAIVRKHYAKWTVRRQERISNLMEAVFAGTFAARGENAAVIQ